MQRFRAVRYGARRQLGKSFAGDSRRLEHEPRTDCAANLDAGTGAATAVPRTGTRLGGSVQ